MKHFLLVPLTILVLIAAIQQAAAREIVLEVGETHRENDLIIRCIEPAEPQLLVLTDCQIWDDFEQVCMFERLIHHYGRLRCVEECQHWDGFDRVCHFATRCELLADQGAFARTSCDVFDEFGNVCRRTKLDLLR
jgi:hypothetical protein